MLDAASVLSDRVSAAIESAFGLSGVDPVLRPSQFADTQANAALALAKRRPSIEAALVDLELPWMDGRALIEALRSCEETKNVRILVVSGARDARDLGADAVVEKPLSRDRLKEVLHRVHEWVPLPEESRSATAQGA